MKEVMILLISIICVVAVFSSIAFRLGQYSGAMKVYQGNANIQYQVIDGRKIDSCVIFKEK